MWNEQQNVQSLVVQKISDPHTSQFQPIHGSLLLCHVSMDKYRESKDIGGQPAGYRGRSGSDHVFRLSVLNPSIYYLHCLLLYSYQPSYFLL